MKVVIVCLSILLFISCAEQPLLPVFNGDIEIVEDKEKSIKLSGTEIVLNEDIHAGYMSVYDSLFLFVTDQYQDYFLYVFNVNNGNLLGTFCPKGHGPGDFYDFYHSEQYVAEDDQIKIWGYDCINNAYLLNLTQSIERKSTVVDSTIIQNWRYRHTRPWSLFFALGKDSILIKNQPEYLANSDDSFNFGAYRLYEKNIEPELETYTLYNRLPIKEDRKTVAELYYSLDRINLESTKLAMAMQYLAQINILEIESGKLKGYRLEDSPDFDKLPLKPTMFYYTDICVGQRIIISLYANTMLGEHNSLSSNVIHIYDWNGQLMKKIELDNMVEQIAFDPVHEFLYGYTEDERIIQYDFSLFSKE